MSDCAFQVARADTLVLSKDSLRYPRFTSPLLRTYTHDLVHELTNVTLVLCVICVTTAWYFPKIRTVSFIDFDPLVI